MPSASVWLALAALAMAGVLGFLAHDSWDRRPGGPVQQLAEARADLVRDAAQAAQAADRAKVIATRQAAIAAAAGAAQAAQQTQIQVVTRTITREIPSVVTPAIDRGYPLPVGLVRVHDAAAAGLPLALVPDPAGRADDAASGVAASTAGAVIASNYGACRADAAQLAGLQAWLTAAAAAAAASPQ